MSESAASIKEWPIIEVAIDELEFDPDNPNRMTAPQERALHESLEQWGNVNFVKVDAKKTPAGKYRIADGEHRVADYKARGIKTIKVISIPFKDDIERRLFRQTMNKLHGSHALVKDMAELKLIWEADRLPSLAKLTAQSEANLKHLLDKHIGLDPLREDKLNIEDELKKPTSAKYGELWQLGRHRLLCGDSSKAADVSTLMNGKLADFIFTSPPYNVGKDYASYNDERSANEYARLMTAIIGNCYSHMREGRILAWNIGVSPKSMPWRHALWLVEGGFSFFRHIVWRKEGAQIPLWQNSRKKPLARNYLPNYNHELIYLVSKGTVEHGAQTDMPEELSMDVWQVSQSSAGGRDHPAAFPVQLVRLAMMAMSAENEVIFEPFGGSGSTLIAAEAENRTCNIMEMDPKYCDIIVKRWEAFTGQKAVKISSVKKDSGEQKASIDG